MGKQATDRTGTDPAGGSSRFSSITVIRGTALPDNEDDAPQHQTPRPGGDPPARNRGDEEGRPVSGVDPDPDRPGPRRDRPEPSAEGYVEPSVRCFACGHRWGYVGADPRSGRCRACGSHAVTPAEPFEPAELEVDRSGAVDPDRPVVRAVGLDATGRTVRFYLRENDDGLAPSMLGIEDALMEVEDAGVLPPVLVELLADRGLEVAGDTGPD
jgi:hypothetical protein